MEKGLIRRDIHVGVAYGIPATLTTYVPEEVALASAAPIMKDNKPSARPTPDTKQVREIRKALADYVGIRSAPIHYP